MLIYGHRFIESENFYHISSIDCIQNTPPSSTLFIEYSENNLDIIKHLDVNSMNFALEVKDITQVVYANSLNASYILVDKDLAKTAQDLAQNYLFDAKILVNVDKESDIEDLALLGIDGVIFSNAIIKINS